MLFVSQCDVILMGESNLVYLRSEREQVSADNHLEHSLHIVLFKACHISHVFLSLLFCVSLFLPACFCSAG